MNKRTIMSTSTTHAAKRSRLEETDPASVQWKDVILMRHPQARVPKGAPAGTDRQVTDFGKLQLVEVEKHLGHVLNRHDYQASKVGKDTSVTAHTVTIPDGVQVFYSPYTRARELAKVVNRVVSGMYDDHTFDEVDCAKELDVVPAEHDTSIYSSSESERERSHELVRLIRECKSGTVIVCGHAISIKHALQYWYGTDRLVVPMAACGIARMTVRIGDDMTQDKLVLHDVGRELTRDLHGKDHWNSADAIAI